MRGWFISLVVSLGSLFALIPPANAATAVFVDNGSRSTGIYIAGDSRANDLRVGFQPAEDVFLISDSQPI